VVLDHNTPTGYWLETAGATPQIVLKLGENLTPAPTPAPPPAQPAPAGQEFTVEGVSIQTVDENSFNAIISTSAKPNTISALKVSPPEIVIDLPKSRMAESCELTGVHSAVKPELANTAAGVRLTLRLARPLVYAIEIRDTQVMVYAHPPDNSGGKLAGKLIVIDPGHGGKENGARAGGCAEKNVNLQIARDLAAALTEQGARVLLTRDSDKLVSLAARAQTAIDSDADFLISVHCNSNLVPDSATGIETYYHMEEPSPKLLAYAVHDGVCKFTGMCDRRPRSDRSLYQGGLAVLRRLSGSGIPGVLLECGYLNNKSDRVKLLDAGYRAKLVAGIIAGFKAYVEGAPIE
jgi:N-acetylmuramoyl-L-alanine amidase